MNINVEILKACQKDDRKAQFLLYKQCYSVLMSVCLRYRKDRDSATEVLNVGFLKIITNLGKYNDTVPFEAWIRRIMINTIIDEFRKERRKMEIIEYTDFQDNNYRDEYVDINDVNKKYEAEDLLKVIRQLPPISQKVFNLYAIDGYSHKEISEMMNISVGTSKWHVSNARKELKRLLKEKLNINVKTG